MARLQNQARDSILQSLEENNEITREELYDTVYSVLKQKGYVEEDYKNKEDLRKRASPLGMMVEQELGLKSYESVDSHQYLTLPGDELTGNAAKGVEAYEQLKEETKEFIRENQRTILNDRILLSWVKSYLEYSSEMPQSTSKEKMLINVAKISYELSQELKQKEDILK